MKNFTLTPIGKFMKNGIMKKLAIDTNVTFVILNTTVKLGFIGTNWKVTKISYIRDELDWNILIFLNI